MVVPKPRGAVVPNPIHLEKMLLVEGDTPSHFFEAFLRHLSTQDDIEIRNYISISELGKYLRTIAATSEFRAKVKSLGIARDAEDDPVGAMRSINAAVQAANLPKGIAVEIAVLPDNASTGMVETLCLRSVSKRPEYEWVNDFFDCLDSKGI